MVQHCMTEILYDSRPDYETHIERSQEITKPYLFLTILIFTGIEPKYLVIV